MCLCESIKCHHNKIASYIENNFILPENKYEVLTSTFKYQNYQYFPFDLETSLYFLCSNGYKKLVELYLKQYGGKIEGLIQSHVLNFFFFINFQ